VVVFAFLPFTAGEFLPFLGEFTLLVSFFVDVETSSVVDGFTVKNDVILDWTAFNLDARIFSIPPFTRSSLKPFFFAQKIN